ncbi:hypothetical protein [Methanococcoides alaskense]|uniref:Uncharacterized protein n=1 Tax=Methanococcoides alaskense TaxID=325778 RepID=A0AA90U0Z1_9EURY|nr:hypothetical protein [Methanococcoides alaskense]MDA0524254.1 hypothetical protein [Methanococcoides alaskense]MDR6223622.1 hypothetical protein [Methanococcoides alaskense]
MTNIKTPHIHKDQNAWIDLTLSKAALMIASIVILSAFYQLSTDFNDLQAQDQLDAEAFGLKNAIDDIGSSSLNSIRKNATYTFNDKNIARAIVTGEYVRLEKNRNGIVFYSVKPLTFKTIPLKEEDLRNILATNFNGNDGNEDHTIDVKAATVLEILSIKGREELILNTGKRVHIEKTPIYLKNNTEVNKIELVLVYQ